MATCQAEMETIVELLLGKKKRTAQTDSQPPPIRFGRVWWVWQVPALAVADRGHVGGAGFLSGVSPLVLHPVAERDAARAEWTRANNHACV